MRSLYAGPYAGPSSTRKLRLGLMLSAIAALLLVAAGCGGPDEQAFAPGDYFATAPGTTWRYLGHGNEFATYSAEVTHRDGNLFQLVVYSGADVAHVYEIEPEKVVRRLRSGEMEFDKQNFLTGPFLESYTVLEAPLEVGHSWEATAVYPNGASVEKRRIEGVGLTLDTPAGRFENVIRVRVSYESGNDSLEHYAPGIGLVRSEYLFRDESLAFEPIVSELEHFTLGK